jgi:hypothetical protein
MLQRFSYEPLTKPFMNEKGINLLLLFMFDKRSGPWTGK